MPTMPDVILIKTTKPFVNVLQTGRAIHVLKQFQKQRVLLVNSLKLHVKCFMNKYIF